MPRTLHRLKPLTVDKAKTPGRYADGGGLYLIVKLGPRRSWAFIYRRGPKATRAWPRQHLDVSLVAARVKQPNCVTCSSQGGDPKVHRDRKRQARPSQDARTITFEAAARNYHERHKAKWHSASTSHQWLRGLEIHAFPEIGNLTLTDCGHGRGTERDRARFGTQSRGRRSWCASEIVVGSDFARAVGHRTTDNPARWALLRHSLPRAKVLGPMDTYRAFSITDSCRRFSGDSRSSRTPSLRSACGSRS